MNLLGFLLARLKEPSSYAGIGMILAAFGIVPSEATLQAIVQLCVATAGLAAVLAPERNSPGATNSPGMSGAAIAVVIAASLSLTACGATGTAAAVAGGTASAVVGAERLIASTDRVIDKACAEYKKGKVVADAAAAWGLLSPTAVARISALESYGDSACANPPEGDPVATAIWVGELIGGVKSFIAGKSGANPS